MDKNMTNNSQRKKRLGPERFSNIICRIKNNDIIIVGAGKYGRRIRLLIGDSSGGDVVFGDNNKDKVGTRFCGCEVKQISELVLQNNKAFWIIPVSLSGESYGWKIYDQICDYVDGRMIVLVDIETLYSNTDENGILKTKDFLESVISEKKEKKKNKQIKKIICMVFRKKPEKDIANGPAGVLRTQEIIFGESVHGIPVEYYWNDEFDDHEDLEYRMQDVINAIRFGREMAEKSKDTVFITHDIFSAAGLAIEGCHYALIYHQQGEVLYEKKAYGLKTFYELESIIKRIELFALQNADLSAFPSEGARHFFWDSGCFDKNEKNSVEPYVPLYNTLNERLLHDAVPVSGIEVDRTTQTFLSIGQMTESKGMDRVVDFLDLYSRETNQRIRWIVVADGPMKDKVISEVNKKQNKLFEFWQFNSLSHEQVNYLFSVSDVYIMMHRLSIFDIATLEAMYNDLQIVLSDIPGNREYCRDENIILVSNPINKKFDIINEAIKKEIRRNKGVYENCFGNEQFEKRYWEMIKELCESAVK